MDIHGTFQQFVGRFPALLEVQKIGVAVSGGGDSVALARLAAEAGLPVVFLHMNYGLRGAESDQDETFVAALAAELGCEFRAERVAPGNNSEEELRRLRYEWFAQCGVDAVLTGHTQDDQAETLLFRILRGTGPAGLSGISESSRHRIYRPLLALTRQEIRDWLNASGFAWREDSSNDRLAYRRNWIRHELMPLIRMNLNPKVDQALAGLAEIATDEESWLRDVVEEALVGLVSVEGDGIVLDCERFRLVPLALQRRMVRKLIEQVKGNLLGIDFAHIEAAIRLALEPEGNGRIQIPGLDLMRSFGLLRWIRLEVLAARSVRNYRIALEFPGLATLPDRAGIVQSTIDAGNPYNGNNSLLDWDRLRAAVDSENPLELRNWRPGDCYRRIGSESPEKLKELFQKHRIPLWRRRSWPIVVLRDTPVWAAEFGPAVEFAAGPGTRTSLRLVWMPDCRD